MQDSCGDCLRQIECEVTGASCPKLDALIRKFDIKGRTTMTNQPKNSATPKTVAEATVEKPVLPAEEPIVPAQAASPQIKVDGNHDRVVDHNRNTLFAGTPEEVVKWLIANSGMVYAINTVGNSVLISSVEYLKKHETKLSLVQRAKAATEKFGKNRKTMLILGVSVVVGLAVKNSRKTVKVEVLDKEDTINGDGDETLDSL